jgi:hypothetical protein
VVGCHYITDSCDLDGDMGILHGEVSNILKVTDAGFPSRCRKKRSSYLHVPEVEPELNRCLRRTVSSSDCPSRKCSFKLLRPIDSGSSEDRISVWLCIASAFGGNIEQVLNCNVILVTTVGF